MDVLARSRYAPGMLNRAVRVRGLIASLLVVGATAASGIGLVGCGSSPPSTSTAAPSPVNGVYTVQIQTVGSSGLPACSSKTAGETAIVTSTSTLESCVAGVWVPIPCLVGGAVAFNSATDSLWACTQGPSGGAAQWSQIMLPQGPAGATGPQGPKGNTGPSGSIGGSGAEALIVQTPTMACMYGGTMIQSGLDLNGDGMLESTEVTSTSYVCNGAPGAMGPAGSASAGLQPLVAVTPVPVGSSQCPSGGDAIELGLDSNGDHLLESSEVQSTSYVCSGTASDAGVDTAPSFHCGDAIAQPGEQCDDGMANGTAGDGCSAACQIVAPWEVERNDSIATATPQWPSSSTWKGSIQPIGDHDYFALTLAAAGTITLTTHDVDTPTNCTSDTVLSLYDSNGTLIASDDDSGPGPGDPITGASGGARCSRISMLQLGARTYYAMVQRYGDMKVISAYQLDLSVQ